MARTQRSTQETECRRCATYCDRVIDPASCVEQACPALYSYDDPLLGRRFMGCLEKVFAVEIDVELFAELQAGRSGYGAVKVARPPLRRCQFRVEQAFRTVHDCSNRRFFDVPDAAHDAVRAFDLRDRCAPG